MPVSMIVGFYYGICDLNLLLQGNHTRTWYLAELVDGFSKIPFAKMPVVVIVVYRILPQLLILLVFVMIIQHTIGSMREDAYRIAELTYRKEVDSSTRLYNKNKYEDMLDMKRPVSKKHPPMPIKDRAAQFAPFAALSGHREALAEEIKKYDEDLGYQ